MLINQGKAVRLRLKRDLRRSIKRGNPWVFADALIAKPEGQPGQVALLAGKDGKPLAKGYCDPSSALSFRVCTALPKERLDDAWAEKGLRAALALRKSLIAAPHTDGIRLINGEGDALPGLVCDAYGDLAVLRLDGPAAEAFWLKGEGVARWLVENSHIRQVYARRRSRGGAEGWPLIGTQPTEPKAFVENNARFLSDVVNGQKTGFFLDQRDNRRLIGELSAGRRVLNVFAYNGGFSIFAGRGGASHVTTVDIAPKAIQDSERHWQINDLHPDKHEGVATDAFAFLKEAHGAGRQWDLTILDPPAFAPSRETADRAIAAYERMVEAGALVTAPGGLLAAASCSSHVSSDEFMEACQRALGKVRRLGTVLYIGGQPIDHPVPMELPQFRYLKFILMRIQ